MIKHILNIIKSWFYKKEKQDPHIEMYELRSDKAEKIRRKHGDKS